MILLTALLVFLCIALFAFGLASRSAETNASLDRRLQLSTGVRMPERGASLDGEAALRGSRIGKDGALTRVLTGVQSMQQLGGQIERAGWRLSVIEFLLFCLISGVIVGFFVSLALPAVVVPAGLLGSLLPLLVMRRAISRRRNKFVKQLIETLPLLANGLKAGVSLMQAMDQTAGQLKPPISEELRRVLRDIQIGATPDDAFLALNERINSNDLDLAVSAIIVQRSTGGNLAEILDKVAHTMRERVRIRGEIKTLTSQQQLSGYLLAAIPLGLLVTFRLLNPHYMAPLFDTVAGHVLLAGAGVGQFLAFFFVRRIVNIEV